MFRIFQEKAGDLTANVLRGAEAGVGETRPDSCGRAPESDQRDPEQPHQYQVELVFAREDMQRAVLYVFGTDGSDSQVFGTVEELRALAWARYPDATIEEVPL